MFDPKARRRAESFVQSRFLEQFVFFFGVENKLFGEDDFFDHGGYHFKLLMVATDDIQVEVSSKTS